MTSYERVTYHPEDGRKKTVLLEIRTVTDLLLIGREVTEDGETKWTKGGTTETVHVVDLKLVDRRVQLHMDNHYGLLVAS